MTTRTATRAGVFKSRAGPARPYRASGPAQLSILVPDFGLLQAHYFVHADATCHAPREKSRIANTIRILHGDIPFASLPPATPPKSTPGMINRPTLTST